MEISVVYIFIDTGAYAYTMSVIHEFGKVIEISCCYSSSLTRGRPVVECSETSIDILGYNIIIIVIIVITICDELTLSTPVDGAANINATLHAYFHRDVVYVLHCCCA